LEQAHQRENARSDIKQGLEAYAAKQVAILQQMAHQFAEEWYPLLVGYGINIEWPEEYRIERVGTLKGKEREVVGLDNEWMEMDDEMFD